MRGGNHFIWNLNTLEFQVVEQVYIKITEIRIPKRLQGGAVLAPLFFSQCYEQISLFTPESESNHPLGEMVISVMNGQIPD